MKARLFMATLTAVLTVWSGEAWALGNANTDRETRVWGKEQSENWNSWLRCPVSNQWLNGARRGEVGYASDFTRQWRHRQERLAPSPAALWRL
jgi:hypothetical protein